LAQLTEQIVRECRARWAAGEMQKTLVAEFGLSKAQMSRAISGKRWAVFLSDKVCIECGEGSLEPTLNNTRTMHLTCAATRKSRHLNRQNNPAALARERAAKAAVEALARAERYATDPVYREKCDTMRLHSLRGRPYLEALQWRVLWTRYRLRETDFLRLLTWQGETCPCGKPFDSKPFIDHDHACCPSPFRRGRVVRDQGERRGTCGKCTRGLLHNQCNTLLGTIEANPGVIQPIGWVAKYLAAPPYWEMSR